jgi:hypothetical protein
VCTDAGISRQTLIKAYCFLVGISLDLSYHYMLLYFLQVGNGKK